MLERRSEPRPARLQDPVLYKTVFNNKSVSYYTKTIPQSAALLQELHIFRTNFKLVEFHCLTNGFLCMLCSAVGGLINHPPLHMT